MFVFGDEGGELDAEALHLLPPPPLDLLPLHCRRRRAAAAVTHAASALVLRAHLHRSSSPMPSQSLDLSMCATAPHAGIRTDIKRGKSDGYWSKKASN